MKANDLERKIETARAERARLDAQIGQLEPNLAAALAHEQRAETIAALLRFEGAAEASVHELEAAWAEFDRVAREIGSRLVEARRKVVANQTNFLDCLRKLMPGFTRLNYAVDPAGTAQLEDLMRELADRGATLRIVRADQFGKNQRPTAITDPHAYKRPVLAFGEVADWVETITRNLHQEQPV